MSELHPSHTVDHYVNAEYEFVCVKCGNVDTYGQGWGALADPCPADRTVSDKSRDEVARVVNQVAEEGLPHPRNLDAALDVIFESITEPYKAKLDLAISEMKWALPILERHMTHPNDDGMLRDFRDAIERLGEE